MYAMKTPPKRGRGRPKGGQQRHAFSITIPPGLNDDLNRYCDESDPHVGKVAAVESAIRMFLAAKGYLTDSKPSVDN